jgi:hypothetical protein
MCVLLLQPSMAHDAHCLLLWLLLELLSGPCLWLLLTALAHHPHLQVVARCYQACQVSCKVPSQVSCLPQLQTEQGLTPPCQLLLQDLLR